MAEDMRAMMESVNLGQAQLQNHLQMLNETVTGILRCLGPVEEIKSDSELDAPAPTPTPVAMVATRRKILGSPLQLIDVGYYKGG
jgi:hypothetical protein